MNGKDLLSYYRRPWVPSAVTLWQNVPPGKTGTTAVLHSGPAVIPANIPVRVRPGGRGLAGLAQTEDGRDDDGGQPHRYL